MNEKSYLDRLKFDPELEKSIIGKFLANFRYVFLLIVTIVAAGLFSFIDLPRRLNPEVKIPIVSVTTAIPGASPQDVESLVTEPLEDQIASLEGVSTITSTSLENFSSLAVEFQSNIDPEKAKDDVQSAVDSITDLPDDAQEPNVQKLDFENQPVWTFIITTKEDEATLIRFGQNLKDRLEKIPSVKSANITGLEEEEIQVLIKQNLQNDYKINPQTLAAEIKASVSSLPAGNINTKSSTLALTIDPGTTSVENLRDIHLNLNGQIVRLGDIATIAVRSKPNQPKAYYADASTPPTKAITFSIFKTDSANINDAVEDVEEETKTVLTEYESKFTLLSILNLSEEVDKQFHDLSASFRDTIILVIIVLFVFLGLRQALVVALAIPLAFLVSFTVMNITGLTLNFLSLFSLILALGLLVDDAIVVVTAVTAYWRTKKFTPHQTGLLVLRDFIVPIWSTTITAVWAFLPLLIAGGIIGEFIKSISLVVSTTLLASTAIAILITLPLMIVLLKPDFPNRVNLLINSVLFLSILGIITVLSLKSPLLPINIVLTAILLIITFWLRKELISSAERSLNRFVNIQKIKRGTKQFAGQGIVDSTKIASWYEKMIYRIISSRSAKNKTLIIVIAFSLFSYLLVPMGFVKTEFFPRVDQQTLFVNMELPPGTNLETTNEEARNLTDELRKTSGIAYVTTQSAQSQSTEDFFGPASASNKALFTLVLPKEEERTRSSVDIAQELREKYESYSKGKISVVELTGGPPAGSDIQIKFLGDDLKNLNLYADETIAYLNTRTGVTNIQKSIQGGSGKIVFIPDRLKLAQAQVTRQEIGFQLRTFASGQTLDSDVNLDGEEKDITFRTSSAFKSPDTLSSLPINTPGGQLPLSALGTFEFKSTPTQITREDRKRTISVTAAASESSQIPTENKELEKFANSLNLAEGYEWKTGGVNEENQQSVNSILQAMVIALILITATMVLQFGSFRKASIILLKIPLAISGVFIVFALTATPLSFPTLIGILALFGITVYQSMLIVDKISKNQKANMNLKHAITDASASRVEPILFGTITTVVGLIPITLSDPLWRGLGGAIIAGLLFSGALMLVFIPVAYYKIFEKEAP